MKVQMELVVLYEHDIIRLQVIIVDIHVLIHNEIIIQEIIITHDLDEVQIVVLLIVIQQSVD